MQNLDEYYKSLFDSIVGIHTTRQRSTAGKQESCKPVNDARSQITVIILTSKLHERHSPLLH